uniref:Uncharacterized protein n=1 Tax=Ascaris lumbricoides TaxID=6252 RepID=A0A0M3HUC2_ASCLU
MKFLIKNTLLPNCFRNIDIGLSSSNQGVQERSRKNRKSEIKKSALRFVKSYLFRDPRTYWMFAVVLESYILHYTMD